MKQLMALFFAAFIIAEPLDARTHKQSAAVLKTTQELDQYITHALKEGRTVGCAVAVVHKDKVVFLKTYGVRKKGSPEKITENTVFQLGSISKPITATLVALLQSKKMMNIQDLVQSRYTFMNPQTRVQHLLSHSTGYVRAGWNQKIETKAPKNTLLQDLKSVSQTKPGSAYDYHNFVFSLIEEYLEAKTQRPFDVLLSEHLFQPLGMKQASIGAKAYQKAPNRAHGHVLNHRKRSQPCSFSYAYHQNAASAGGMNATIKDMIAFLKFHLAHEHAEKVSFLYKPVVPTNDACFWMEDILPGKSLHDYALGWRVVNTSHMHIVYHGGLLRGVANFLAFIPEKQMGIVILNNCSCALAKNAAILFLRGQS